MIILVLLKDGMVERNGLVRYWDKDAQAPYLLNSETRQLVTYDDEESIKLKCEYVLENRLKGMMFWQSVSRL